MFSLFAKQAIDYFSDEEKERIKSVISDAESKTSGEIRVYVEHFCKADHAIDKAKEIFRELKMDLTANRNAVLIYIALTHRQLAIYGDAGIHAKTGNDFWQSTLNGMLEFFKAENYCEGVLYAVQSVGEVLAHHFPNDPAIRKNELPDDMVFGK